MIAELSCLFPGSCKWKWLARKNELVEEARGWVGGSTCVQSFSGLLPAGLKVLHSLPRPFPPQLLEVAVSKLVALKQGIWSMGLVYF